ncbi:hypothetical protein CEE37_00095 [candidate division LCP-89 bacterium B3_LCP]|uniref:Bifunctional metallophosphatase/5'-nucleotidase n=1 Tax=candidate division LCP-89 bacterium B3_LCP TaxID=2012998 RepID=A0A532V4H9_UNCL8|nr:MAG: hypothetical protein CEE37_00095 [candidate division LCP-89 bacterium B3_LCP]
MQNRTPLYAILLLIVSAFLWQSCQKAPEPLPVTVLHWNDFHAQNQPFETYIDSQRVRVGGAAYLATLLDSLRLHYPRSLTFHAGDEFTGTPISAITKGQSQIEILNYLKPDAYTPGNHEFDHGWISLKERYSGANFPVLCCNVFDSLTGQTITEPAMIFERAGVKIGVIGSTIQYLSSYVLSDALPGLRIEDPAPIINKWLDEVEEITDIQIALTHHGVNLDKHLAESCPRLDLIVGGHKHARLFEPLVESGVPILQAGAKGQYLGLFRAEVDTVNDRIVAYTGQLIPVYSDSLQPREDIAVLIEEQESQVAEGLDRPIGVLLDPWERNWDGESNVGSWTADAITRITGKDIAFINSGGLRKNVPEGTVTERDMWELHPFGNRLMTFNMSGLELKRAVSHQAREMRDINQISGLRYRARKNSGELLEITVGGMRVESEKMYTVVANEYITSHPQKYFGFELVDRPITDTGWLDRDLAMKAFLMEGRVSSQTDGRIVLVD